jgi:hypothetical protein
MSQMSPQTRLAHLRREADHGSSYARAALREYPMRRECAWCGKRLEPDGVANRPGVVTHGICDKCKAKAERK